MELNWIDPEGTSVFKGIIAGLVIIISVLWFNFKDLKMKKCYNRRNDKNKLCKQNNYECEVCKEFK